MTKLRWHLLLGLALALTCAGVASTAAAQTDGGAEAESALAAVVEELNALERWFTKAEQRSADESRHAAISIANASRIVPAGFPQSAVFVADAIVDIPVVTPRSADTTLAAGQRIPRRGQADLMSIRESIFFISG